jgi:hypothetical protein
MRVIVRSAAFAFLVATLGRADAHDDVIAVFTKMAAALTQTGVDGGTSIAGNVDEFMSAFSRDFQEYDGLKQNVMALVNNAEISSALDPITEEPGSQTYKIDVDWFLQIRSLQQDGPITSRREVIHCELRREKKQWKIISLAPVNFFAPANLGK